jgi:hypothetical protein
MKIVGEMNDSLVVYPAVELLRTQFAGKANDDQENNRQAKGHRMLLSFGS